MHATPVGVRPLDERKVLGTQAAPGIDDQHEAPQGVPYPKRLEERHPLASLGRRRLRVTISGQIDDPPARTEFEVVEQAGLTRGLAGAGEGFALGDGVDRTGLARIGTAGESDLGTLIGRELRGGGHAQKEIDLGEA